jgi:colanic acid biosynthesis glycosyl transferase WcaI
MLSLVFHPDTVSTATTMTELAQGWSEMGHDVTVLTSMPHYNPSPEVLQNPTYRARWLRFYSDSRENGIRVLRVRMPRKGQRIWLRALDYLWFQIVTMIVAIAELSRQDVVFVPSPPITLGLNGYLLSRMLRAVLIYDVRELWPDAPVRMGLLRNRFLIWMIYSVEHFVYRKAAAITSIARSFRDNLIRRGVPREKVFVTPLFVDIDWLGPRPKANAFARKHGLEGKFVVLYAGNIGLTQGLEILVDVGRALQEDRGAVILVVGNGAGRARFEQAVEESGLKNFILLPLQPNQAVPDLYGTADLCVMPMRFGFSYDTVPSKIYTAMATGRAIVCACEPDTESAWLLAESKSGIPVAPESTPELVKAIRKLRDSPELGEEMGRKGREWVVAHCRKEIGIAIYGRVIDEVAGDAAVRPQ